MPKLMPMQSLKLCIEAVNLFRTSSSFRAKKTRREAGLKSFLVVILGSYLRTAGPLASRPVIMSVK